MIIARRRQAPVVAGKGVQRVRYAGLFRGRERDEHLETCNERVVHYYQSNGLKPPKSVKDLIAEDHDAQSSKGAICKACGAKQVMRSRVNADVMRRILYHTAAIIGWLAREPTASIIELYRRSLEKANQEAKPGESMELSILGIPLLEIYVLQEQAKSKAANADQEPEAQAQPPPDSETGGRDAA